MAILHCPSCGYNLTGLPGNRCPECGREFDLALLALSNQRDSSEIIPSRAELTQRAHFGRILPAQAIVLLLLSIVLDGGAMMRAYVISLSAYWAAVLVGISLRRSFTKRHLAFIRFGWIAIAMVGLVAVPALTELALRAWEGFRR